MLRRLTPPPRPRWETLVEAEGDFPAVRVLFAPITDQARELAGEASAAVRAAAPEEVREEIAAAFDERGKLLHPLSATAGKVLLEMSRVTVASFIRSGILDWTGLGGPGDDDQAIKPTDLFAVLDPNGEPMLGEDGKPQMESGIDWFLANEDLRRAADRTYVLPDALRLAEKNASAGSPHGTSKGAMPASDTATTRATSKTKVAAAKPARTASTGRKPRKRKPSGG